MKKYILPGLLVIGAALRLYHLGLAHMWYDELFTASVSALPISQAYTAVAGDVHPPLWYALTWIMSHAGLSSEWWYRLPSAALSLAAIWLVWEIAKALDLPEAARIGGAAFMVIGPMQLYFAQEARMYALLQFLALAALLAILRRRWVWAGLAMTTMLYAHNYGLIYLPVLGLVALWRQWNCDVEMIGDFIKLKCWAWLLAFALPLLAWLPWAVVLAGQMHNIAGYYWIAPVAAGDWLYCLYMVVWGFAVTEAWRPVAALLAFGLLLYAVVQSISKRPPGWFTLLVFGLLPLVLAGVASALWNPILLFRGIIPSSGPLYLLCAWTACDGPKWKPAYILALLAPAMVAGLWGYYVYNPTDKGIDYKLIETVRQGLRPGDVIAHANESSYMALKYYVPNAPSYKLPSCEAEPMGALSFQTREGLGIETRTMDQLTQQYNRVWLIWAQSALCPACQDREMLKIVRSRPADYTIIEEKLVSVRVWIIDHETNAR